MMHVRGRGFTLIEMLVLLGCLLGIVVLMLMANMNRQGPRGRTICGANLRGIHQSMSIYAIGNRDQFPVAGNATPGGKATGFREGDRVNPATAHLDDNVTASLWLLIRDGSAQTGSFICNGDRLAEIDEIRLPDDSAPVRVSDTQDFLSWRNLSYSPINMYHEDVGEKWSPRADPDIVLMGDNNASDDPDRYTAGPDHGLPHPARSPNHDGPFHLLFGDGHVAFQPSPFVHADVGRPALSVYAGWSDGKRTAVQLEHDAGDGDHLPLLPIYGNDGVSLSGETVDTGTSAAAPATVVEPMRWEGAAVLALAGVIVAWVILRASLWGIQRLSRG